MIAEPEKSAKSMSGFGESIAKLLQKKGASEFIGRAVIASMDRFNMMYETLYDMAQDGTNWNGYSQKARETLEKVNLS